MRSLKEGANWRALTHQKPLFRCSVLVERRVEYPAIARTLRCVTYAMVCLREEDVALIEVELTSFIVAWKPALAGAGVEVGCCVVDGVDKASAVYFVDA